MSRRWRKPALALLGVVVLLASGGWWSWREMERELDRPLALESPVLFQIRPGTSVARLAETFVARGWLAHALSLRIEAERAGLAARIQAGHYELSSRDSPRSLLRRFAAGDIKTYSVTFVEGATFADIRRQTARLPGIIHELRDASAADVMAALGASGDSPEGWLFPSTYRYRHASTDRELWARAYRKMQATLSRLWEARADDLPYRAPYEALIMASIVEKETGLPAERSEIAGVFVRRLRQKMRLQTDPTVIYGLGVSFDGNLRRVDLERDTPWNTYTRGGLPPTPICSPGEAAIRASLSPSDGKALYFVARGDGSHVFSATLEAHNAAVRRHQLRGNRQ